MRKHWLTTVIGIPLFLLGSNPYHSNTFAADRSSLERLQLVTQVSTPRPGAYFRPIQHYLDSCLVTDSTDPIRFCFPKRYLKATNDNFGIFDQSANHDVNTELHAACILELIKQFKIRETAANRITTLSFSDAIETPTLYVDIKRKNQLGLESLLVIPSFSRSSVRICQKIESAIETFDRAQKELTQLLEQPSLGDIDTLPDNLLKLSLEQNRATEITLISKPREPKPTPKSFVQNPTDIAEISNAPVSDLFTKAKQWFQTLTLADLTETLKDDDIEIVDQTLHLKGSDFSITEFREQLKNCQLPSNTGSDPIPGENLLTRVSSLFTQESEAAINSRNCRTEVADHFKISPTSLGNLEIQLNNQKIIREALANQIGKLDGEPLEDDTFAVYSEESGYLYAQTIPGCSRSNSENALAGTTAIATCQSTEGYNLARTLGLQVMKISAPTSENAEDTNTDE